MKYLWKYKTILIVLVMSLVLQLDVIANPVWAAASTIREALLRAPANMTSSRAQVFAHNDLLAAELARSYGEQIRLEYELIKAGVKVNQQDGDNESPRDESEILEPNDEVVTVESSLVRELLSAKIAATPLFRTTVDRDYLLESVDASLLPQTLDNVYIRKYQYLLGKLVDSSGGNLIWQPLQNTGEPLLAKLPNGNQVPIKILNHFTYQIEVPALVKSPEGLFESQTGLILGIKIDETKKGDTNLVSYQLPWQPKINQEVSAVQVVVMPEADLESVEN